MPSELANFITGQVALYNVKESLHKFVDKQKKKCDEFIATRLASETKTRSFWDKETKDKVLTFKDMNKSLVCKTQ